MLVPKDFSLRSTNASTGSINTSPTTHGLKRSNDGLVVVNSSAKGGSGGLGVSPMGKSESGGTSNKRNRTNGAIIGVSDMIALAANTSSSNVPTNLSMGANNNVQTTSAVSMVGNNSTSKYVTGSFDLEEHIRALPQLADTHLVNALHLRNQEMKSTQSTSSATIGAGGTTVMMVATNTPPSSQLKTNGGGLLMKTVPLNQTSGATHLLPVSSIQHSNNQQPENLSSQTKLTPSVTSSISMIPSTMIGGSKSSGLNLSMGVNASTAGINTTTATMEALPLRLVTAAAAGTVNNTNAPRMQVSPSVLIKLGNLQTIAVPTATAGQMTTMQTVDGNLVPLATPLIIRGTTTGSPVLMTTPLGGANSNNKPVDLSIQQTESTATSANIHATVRSPPHAYLSVTPIASPNGSAAAAATTTASPMLVSFSSPASKISLAPGATTTNIVTDVNGPSKTANSSNSSLFSTVISSHGSINQCDGLAALAEIALQQARNSIT